MEHSAFFLFFIPFIVLGLASMIFWIWALIHCVRNSALDESQRIIWLLVIIFLHALGALIYVFAAPRAPKV